MNVPEGQKPFDIVEVRFKNSRKEYFRNLNNLSLNVGDVIAVEASPGHDIGIISLTGELVRLQLKKRNINFDSDEIRKVYRKARPGDVDKWKEAQGLEVSTMYRARTIALQLGLEMKLSDVEYQGDKSKAIFYYTADARVDFRELIKVLADEFKVRIEMRQIGARQEASRLGGIGACGRELCCSTWLTDFRTVATSAARYQQLSLNPLKLAGQCGKLKCCLNYELDSYLDALKEFPDMEGKKLFTKKGEAFHQKTDIFKRMMWFSYRSEPDVFIPVKVDHVKEVLELNAKNEQPEDLVSAVPQNVKAKVTEHSFENVVGQDSLTRFDRRPKQKHPQNKGKQQQGKNKPQNQNKSQKQQGQQNPQNKQQSQDKQQNQQGQNKQGGQQNQNRQQNQQQNKNRPHNKPQQQNKQQGNQNKPANKPDEKKDNQ
jgi:cell fate regulator YaaT (PSP1 superfamily)